MYYAIDSVEGNSISIYIFSIDSLFSIQHLEI